jgi:hypothetical protein
MVSRRPESDSSALRSRSNQEALNVTRNAQAALVALVLAFALVPTALAGKPGGSRCTQNAPSVVVDNNYGWGQWGSYGLPGQRLAYAIDVFNNDAGCGSSAFAVTFSAPSGFAVSVPTSTISLKSGSSGYLWAYVTSPSTAADGDYPLVAKVTRAGTGGSFTSSYKVYSSDTVAPTLFWPNPGDGQTISGRSYNFTVSSNDDHAVKQIELAIDGVSATTTQCDGIAYTCQLYYKWSMGSRGQHTATFKSYDWLGNVAVLTVGFTVG